jgi:hypothetical protein
MTDNRKSLKNFFAAGKRPTEEHFHKLIDAALIMEDEAFRKTGPDGLHIATTKGGNGLLSFGRVGAGAQFSDSLASWRLSFVEKGTNILALQREPNRKEPLPTVLTIEQGLEGNARVSFVADMLIGAKQHGDTDQPRSALDVGGAIRSHGRLGDEWVPIDGDEVYADGAYHAITPPISGCVAYEIIAGVGQPNMGSGRFAMVHAIATNCFNPGFWDNPFRLKNPIRQQHSYYGRRSDRLQLCWERKGLHPKGALPKDDDPNTVHGRDGLYRLMIRSRTSYDDPKVKIRVFVTKLWYDSQMQPGPSIEPRDNQRVSMPGVSAELKVP